MENNTIKSVMFGGFDKQDVMQYIEKSAKEAADAQQELREENEELREQLNEQNQATDELRAQVEALTAERDELKKTLEHEQCNQQALEPLKPEVEQLRAEVARLREEAAALRPDAETYARFRDRMGSIECESQKRAAELEDTTAEQMLKTLNLFRGQYQQLMTAYDTAASYINNELRKIEVNLTQLPRAMDKTGSELNEISEMLGRIHGKSEK